MLSIISGYASTSTHRNSSLQLTNFLSLLLNAVVPHFAHQLERRVSRDERCKYMLFSSGAHSHRVREYFGCALFCDSDYCTDRNEDLQYAHKFTQQ